MTEAPFGGRILWTIGQYAEHSRTPVRTALRRVLRAHDEAVARGAGGWLHRGLPPPGAKEGDRLRTWWYINVEMMRAQAPHLLRPDSTAKQLEALREEHDDLVQRVERMSRTVRYVGEKVERIDKRVGQLELPFSRTG